MISREIRYGTPLHDRIREAVWQRYNLSAREMANRHDIWKAVDELFRAYVLPTEKDRYRESQRKAGKPEYVTIHIPYSYATLLAAHTYWSSVFLSRSPILQFTGRHGETQQRIQAVEALMDYQVMVGGMVPHLYVWLLDAGKYGMGVLGNYWAEEYSEISRIVEAQRTVLGIPIGETRKVKQSKRVRKYVGNKVFNVRPHDFFPDPRVSLLNFQQGEFCGRLTQAGWNAIVRNKELGEYFNLEHLRRFDRSGFFDRVSLSVTDNLPVGIEGLDASLTGDSGLGPFELLEMTVELIPSEWGLGEGSYPEKWLFTTCGGRSGVVIGARPQGLAHDRFPFSLLLYEPEGYAVSARGMLEIIKPLNDVLDWLVNSHMFNVRQAINNQFIVDPSRVNVNDLTSGEPGIIARLLPQAYGTDVRTAMTQVPVQDMTMGHIRNMQLIAEIVQRVSGATDNIQGLVNAGGRKTATEVRTSSSFSINRLKTTAEFFSAVGWGPLAQMMLQNTQQLYDDTQVFRIAGDLINRQTTITVTPDIIEGFYDFVPVDGTLPVDRFAQASLWKEILLGMAKMPQLAAQYDVAGIFSWMAQLAGLKNITQFKVAAAPDATLQAQVASGNLVPLQEAVNPNAAIQ